MRSPRKLVLCSHPEPSGAPWSERLALGRYGHAADGQAKLASGTLSTLGGSNERLDCDRLRRRHYCRIGDYGCQRRALAGREVRATASIFPRGSTSARSLRFRSESRLTRKPVKNKNSPRESRRRRLPIRARLLGLVRDQDERRLSAIPGHWSDGTVFCDHTP